MKRATHKQTQFRRMRRAILDSDCAEVEKLLSKATFKNMSSFRYAVYRQQYLELIDAQENQKAFSILMPRLKELEFCADCTDEFHDLGYLLSCKSVTEARSFHGWDGVKPADAALVEQYARWLDFNHFQREGRATMSPRPENTADAYVTSERMAEELSTLRSELTALRAKVARLESELH